MENQSNLSSLPTDLLNQLLLRVGSSSIIDLSSDKVALRAFNEISQEDQFLKDVDLIFMYSTYRLRGPEIIDFRFTCLHRGNPTTLFLKGASDFFRLHILDDGLAMMGEGAHQGGMMTNYWYTMLRLVMQVTDNDFRSIAHIRREDVVALIMAMKNSDRRAWPYPLPEEFQQRKHLLKLSISASKCGCKTNNWALHLDDHICNSCFWKQEVPLFCQTMPDHVLEWPY